MLPPFLQEFASILGGGKQPAPTAKTTLAPTPQALLAQALVRAIQSPDASAVAAPIVPHSQIVHGEGPEESGLNTGADDLMTAIMNDRGDVIEQLRGHSQSSAARPGVRPKRSASTKNTPTR